MKFEWFVGLFLAKVHFLIFVSIINKWQNVCYIIAPAHYIRDELFLRTETLSFETKEQTNFRNKDIHQSHSFLSFSSNEIFGYFKVCAWLASHFIFFQIKFSATFIFEKIKLLKLTFCRRNSNRDKLYVRLCIYRFQNVFNFDRLMMMIRKSLCSNKHLRQLRNEWC